MRRNANCVFFLAATHSCSLTNIVPFPPNETKRSEELYGGGRQPPPPRGETDGNEDKEGDLGGASASGSVEAPPSLVGQRCVIDRLFSDGKKEKKKYLARSFSLDERPPRADASVNSDRRFSLGGRDPGGPGPVPSVDTE